MMQRTTILRNTLITLAVGAWVFALLALGSFHSTDWPSHEIYPYPATQNLCGSAGAFVAYYAFLTLGQGVFPVLLFVGIVLALKCFSGQVTACGCAAWVWCCCRWPLPARCTI